MHTSPRLARLVSSCCAVAFAAGVALWAPGAAAAQTCVAKCADEEAACIKRTNNKGQCGSKAKACTAKCK